VVILTDNPLVGVLKFFETYGYYILFIVVFLENAAFLGLFIPGEIFLLAAGFYASLGGFNIFIVGSIAFVGAVCGDNLAYWFGRKGGRPLFLKYGRFFKITPERMQRAEDFYARHGAKTVVIGRWTQYLRIFMAPLAGIYRMNYFKFLVYDLLSSVLWAAANSALGYFLGKNYRLLEAVIKTIGWGAFAAILVAIIIIIIVIRIRILRGRRSGNQVIDKQDK
jgi:undecaprenyl-diphosphatase